MVKRTLVVRASWDEEAHVWVATSDDVPGLVAEARTPEELSEKLQVMVPELLELNGFADECADGVAERHMIELPVVVMSEQITKVRVFA